MSIELSPRLEALVREKVASGQYHDAEEVLENALTLLAKHDSKARNALFAAIDEGLADLEQGRFTEFNSVEELDAFFATL